MALSSDISRSSSALPADSSELARARDRALAFLERDQRDGSHWVGVLSSSALATSISLAALHLIDRSGHLDAIRRGRQWLADTQEPDGGWGDAVIDPSNVNATSLALSVLHLTRDDGGADLEPTLRRAWARLEQFGGWPVVGDPDRCTLSGPCRTLAAIAGLMDFRRIKRLRPEVILLPLRLRRTISTTFPAYLSISTLHAMAAPHPLNALPSFTVARRRALAWLERAQGPNGSFEESAFLTSVILVTLTVAGYGHLPWLRPAFRFVEQSQRSDGSWPIDRDLETFDTDLSVFAFRAAGRDVPQAGVVRDWLLDRQLVEPCFPTSAGPGGWAWAMPAGWPDSDDTSYTLLALRQLGVPPGHAALERGSDWLAGMQNGDGSWSTFVRGSRMPFDHDCPYITGHVLSALQATERLQRQPRILARALAYLQKAQRADGSFPSIWFREATAGTASVLEALADCGLGETPLAAGARAALLRGQQVDGGWSGVRGQASTAEETSWAVMALTRLAAVDPEALAAIGRGVRWLLQHQRADGTWAAAPIGLYYSAMWYSDSYYAVTLPLQALGRAAGLHGAA